MNFVNHFVLKLVNLLARAGVKTLVQEDVIIPVLQLLHLLVVALAQLAAAQLVPESVAIRVCHNALALALMIALFVAQKAAQKLAVVLVIVKKQLVKQYVKVLAKAVVKLAL